MVERPKRILFVDHTAVLGGGELALLALLRQLDRDRYEPVVLLLSDGPLVQELEGLAETHILPLPESLLKTRRDALSGSKLPFGTIAELVRYMGRLAGILGQLRPRILHSNSLKADILAGILARYHRIPQVWHIRDRIAEDYLPKSAVFAFRKACRLLPGALIANSRSTLDSLKLNGGPVAVVINSGLDLAPFLQVGASARSLPDAMAEGLEIQIGIIGRISPWKGQEIFLEAAAIVAQTFPRTHFHIVGAPLFGEDAFEEGLRDLTRTLGLERSTTFAGFRRDIPEYIGGLDIIVHASIIPEPFGQVIVQGMAAGKPVIATEGGGPSEIIEDRRTGFLVPRKNSDALARAIISILTNPRAAQVIARRGQTDALRKYGSETTTRAVEDLYDRLLAP